MISLLQYGDGYNMKCFVVNVVSESLFDQSVPNEINVESLIDGSRASLGVRSGLLFVVALTNDL